MKKRKKPAILNFGHILLGCRFDVWIRLLIENHFHISPAYIPQAILITCLSLLLFPFALIERLILAIPIHKQKPKQPLFILGHWRSGTTFLQNLLSKDPDHGFFDPVNTITINNAWLLKPILTPLIKKQLPTARPMDNMVYQLDLPMEEVYALANTCTLSFLHLLTFPENVQRYLDATFVESLPQKDRRRWERAYKYLIKKQTFICKGKPLILKSPSNTAIAAELYHLYPDACFLHIHRDPYEVIVSTIYTLQKILDTMALQNDHKEQLLEDLTLTLFTDIFTQLFKDMEKIPPEQFMEISYEEFEKQPLEYLEKIYAKFHLSGFEKAKPRFKQYLDGQKNYKKNHLRISPALVERINKQLGFYFTRYGYEMKDPNTFSQEV